MGAAPTVTGSFAWAIAFLAEVALKWVPSTVSNFVGTGAPAPAGEVAPGTSIISSPVTAQQAVEYLQTQSAAGVWDKLYHYWGIYVSLSLFISLLLATLIIYCAIRILQIRAGERAKFAAAARTVVVQDAPKTELRWKHILEEADGEDEQGWRLAILEADIMLSELLDTLGYKGETIADKLKQVDRADFRTIDMAWEAHKVRNRIAHQGISVALSETEAHRTLALYQRVFREFNFIE